MQADLLTHHTQPQLQPQPQPQRSRRAARLCKWSSAWFVCLVISACGSAPSMPAPVVAEFSAQLSGSAEVPPVMTPASGTVAATLATDTGRLHWTISHTGLSSPPTAAHFHGPASSAQNAGVVLPIAGAAGLQSSPVTGSAVLTPGQAAELMAGRWYVNVHTAANPSGEIRGQLVARP